MFKDLAKRSQLVSAYKSYWDFVPTDRAAGVGLIIASYISKYVQRVHRSGGRFIAIDLYLPGKKLSIINLYAPPSDKFTSKGRALTKLVIDHIKLAESKGFQCIIIGDLMLIPINTTNY